MANHPSAKKRARQNEKRRLRNRQHRSKMRTVVKKVETAISGKDAETASNSLKDAIRILDKSATKGIIHKNLASRKKSILTKKVNRLSTAP